MYAVIRKPEDSVLCTCLSKEAAIVAAQLEKSKEGTDIANLRSAYAAGQVAALSGLSDGSLITAAKSYGYDPNDGDGLVSTEAKGAKIGQGTSTNGNADTSKLPKECVYSNGTDVRQHPIRLKFNTQGLTEVKFK